MRVTRGAAILALALGFAVEDGPAAAGSSVVPLPNVMSGSGTPGARPLRGLHGHHDPKRFDKPAPYDKRLPNPYVRGRDDGYYQYYQPTPSPAGEGAPSVVPLEDQTD